MSSAKANFVINELKKIGGKEKRKRDESDTYVQIDTEVIKYLKKINVPTNNVSYACENRGICDYASW